MIPLPFSLPTDENSQIKYFITGLIIVISRSEKKEFVLHPQENELSVADELHKIFSHHARAFSHEVKPSVDRLSEYIPKTTWEFLFVHRDTVANLLFRYFNENIEVLSQIAPGLPQQHWPYLHRQIATIMSKGRVTPEIIAMCNILYPYILNQMLIEK